MDRGDEYSEIVVEYQRLSLAVCLMGFPILSLGIKRAI